MNSSANRYIIGLSVASEPRQINPNTPVETDPSSSTSFGLWLTSPRMAPAAMPARTSTPTASTRRCPMTPMIIPTAGNTPLSTSAATVLNPVRAKQVVEQQGSADIEDRDHRDRPQPPDVHGAYSIGRFDL
jgi:hypothetical protein